MPSRARAEAVNELPLSDRGNNAAEDATPSAPRREMTTPARSSSRPPLQPLRMVPAEELREKVDGRSTVCSSSGRSI